MPAFVYKVQFAVWYQPVEFTPNKRWRNGIVVSPYQAGWLFDLVQLFSQVITDRTFGKRNDLDHFYPVICDLKNFIYQFFGSRIGIIERYLCFLFDILIITTLRITIAMKFSTVVAGWLKDSTSISAAWLPFLSFVLVMIGVILLIRIGAKLIQSAVELVLLGWLNKLTGIILYAALYITMYSVLLFYAEKLNIIKHDALLASRTYAFIQPWGPKAIELFSAVIPWFRGMFEELSHFFESIHHQVK